MNDPSLSKDAVIDTKVLEQERKKKEENQKTFKKVKEKLNKPKIEDSDEDDESKIKC